MLGALICASGAYAASGVAGARGDLHACPNPQIANVLELEAGAAPHAYIKYGTNCAGAKSMAKAFVNKQVLTRGVRDQQTGDEIEKVRFEERVLHDISSRVDDPQNCRHSVLPEPQPQRAFAVRVPLSRPRGAWYQRRPA